MKKTAMLLVIALALAISPLVGDADEIFWDPEGPVGNANISRGDFDFNYEEGWSGDSLREREIYDAGMGLGDPAPGLELPTLVRQGGRYIVRSAPPRQLREPFRTEPTRARGPRPPTRSAATADRLRPPRRPVRSAPPPPPRAQVTTRGAQVDTAVGGQDSGRPSLQWGRGSANTEKPKPQTAESAADKPKTKLHWGN